MVSNQGAAVKSENKTPRNRTASKTHEPKFWTSRKGRKQAKGTAPSAAHFQAGQEGPEVAPLTPTGPVLPQQGSWGDGL